MLKLELIRYNFIGTKPLSISFHTWDSRDSYVIFLYYQDFVGIGEANPFKPITGDSPEELVQDAKKIHKIPLDPKKDNIESLHLFLDDKNIQCQSLRSSVDAAYHDLYCQLKKIPVYKLYSEKMRLVASSITVFVQDSIEETKREAVQLQESFPDLKIVKIKLKGEQDKQRCLAIKEVFADSVSYCLDANQAFTSVQEAIVTLEEIQKILGDVILVEEPCPKGDLKKLKEITDNISGMKVFADETAATLENVEKIIDKNAAHGVNIKLQKAGGIYYGQKIARLCSENGLDVMVGAMIEGPISITAGAHFAATIPGLVLSDLDTDLDLPVHTENHSVFKNGMKIPSDYPGLGVVINVPEMEILLQKNKVVIEKLV